jgi:hypothetical protein
MAVAMIVVSVGVFWLADVFHFVDVATFGAALDGAVAGDLRARVIELVAAALWGESGWAKRGRIFDSGNRN